MSKQIYFNAKDNEWLSIRGHDRAGAIWIEPATTEEIKDHLAKINSWQDSLQTKADKSE